MIWYGWWRTEGEIMGWERGHNHHNGWPYNVEPVCCSDHFCAWCVQCTLLKHNFTAIQLLQVSTIQIYSLFKLTIMTRKAIKLYGLSQLTLKLTNRNKIMLFFAGNACDLLSFVYQLMIQGSLIIQNCGLLWNKKDHIFPAYDYICMTISFSISLEKDFLRNVKM